MSTILSYSKTITSLESPNGTVVLAQPLKFSMKQKQAIRLIKCSFSSQIPNLYTLGTFNNALISVSRDGGVNYTDIQLPNGIYTCAYIEAALNTAIQAWYTTASDWGIQIRYNLATNIVYCALDSTKLKAPGTQLAIHFGASSSLIYEALGFTITKEYKTDGVHSADVYAKLDWFGNSVGIALCGFGPLSIANGTVSEEIARVPLSTSSVANEYIYPSSGITSPIIQLNRPLTELRSFEVKLYGSRVDTNGVNYPLYITEGNIELSFELFWS